MRKRITSGLVVFLGLGLIGLAVLPQLFSRAPAFEEMTDDFRPLMTNASLATMSSDLEGMKAMADEMRTEMLPDMATALKMEPTAFQGFVGERFPATAQGIEALPAITERFSDMGATFSQQQENFRAADAIPTSSLPVTVFPWGLVAVGALTMAAGIFMFRSARVGSYLALGLGVLMVAAALLMSWPSKTTKADDLNVALRGVMGTEQVAEAQEAVAVVMNMGTELQNQMLPALAAELRLTEPEMASYITSGYPAVGAVFESMDEMQGRFDGMVATMVANVDNYETIKPLSMEPINWLFIAAGTLTAAIAGFALWMPASIPRHRPAVIAH